MAPRPSVYACILKFSGGEWTPHKVEMAVWTYYVLREFKPDVLEDLPEATAASEKRLSNTGVVVTDTENGLNGEVSNGLESLSDEADKIETETEATDTSPPSITESEPKESNGSVPSSEPSLKEPEPEPTPTESEVGQVLFTCLTVSKHLIFYFWIRSGS